MLVQIIKLINDVKQIVDLVCSTSVHFINIYLNLFFIYLLIYCLILKKIIFFIFVIYIGNYIQLFGTRIKH